MRTLAAITLLSAPLPWVTADTPPAVSFKQEDDRLHISVGGQPFATNGPYKPPSKAFHE